MADEVLQTARIDLQPEGIGPRNPVELDLIVGDFGLRAIHRPVQRGAQLHDLQRARILGLRADDLGIIVQQARHLPTLTIQQRNGPPLAQRPRRTLEREHLDRVADATKHPPEVVTDHLHQAGHPTILREATLSLRRPVC